MSPTLRREPAGGGSLGAALGAPRAPGTAAAAAYTRAQVNPRAGQAPPTAAARQRSAAAPAASDTDGDARALLAAVIEAKGGLDALEAVRTVVAEATTTFQLDQGAVPSMTTTYVVYPDKFRVDATLGTDRVVQIYNAGSAWQKDPAGVREAPAPMRAEFEASVKRDTIPLLIGAARGRLVVRSRAAEKTRDGRKVRALE